MGVFKRAGEKGVSWYIDYYADGVRARRGGYKGKREAQRALEAARTDVRRGDLRLMKRTRAATLAEFAREYLDWSRQNKRSWKRDRGIVRHLLRFFGSRRLSEIHTFDSKGTRLRGLTLAPRKEP